jgi:hypothetical protein
MGRFTTASWDHLIPVMAAFARMLRDSRRDIDDRIGVMHPVATPEPGSFCMAMCAT